MWFIHTGREGAVAEVAQGTAAAAAVEALEGWMAVGEEGLAGVGVGWAAAEAASGVAGSAAGAAVLEVPAAGCRPVQATCLHAVWTCHQHLQSVTECKLGRPAADGLQRHGC
jgi:hypothetical protein